MRCTLQHVLTLAVCLSSTLTMAADLSLPSLLVKAAQGHRKQHPVPTPTTFNRLDRRQTTATEPTTTFTVTAAPDSTCGFLSASPGNAITCENKGSCTWEGDHVSAIMCQSGLEVSMKLFCIERSIATDRSQCDDVCESNEFNLLCTDASAPFCRTYQYPGGVRDFRCASTRVTRVQSVDFTYDGQVGREFSTFALGEQTASVPTIASIPEPRPSSPEPETPSDTSSPSPSPAPPASGGGGGGSSTNIGAIVGGVLGGVALLALIAFGIYFMRRRRRQHAAVAAAPAPAPQQQPPPVQQVYHPSNPGSPPDAYGWKGGMASPVHSVVSGSPNQQAYDGVSDVQSSRMSHMYSPGGAQPPMAPVLGPSGPGQAGTYAEVGTDASGHHRGQYHEMQ